MRPRPDAPASRPEDRCNENGHSCCPVDLRCAAAGSDGGLQPVRRSPEPDREGPGASPAGKARGGDHRAAQCAPAEARLRRSAFLLGTAYLEAGDAPFASVELQKAPALGYDPKQVLPELGKSLIAQEKFKEALDATDPAQGFRAPRAHRKFSTCARIAQLGNRQVAAAKASLDLAMILKPDFAEGMLSQARIAMGQGDGETATALVDKALAIAPKNVDGWLLKGGMQRQAGDPDGARTSYLKAIQATRAAPPRTSTSRLSKSQQGTTTTRRRRSRSSARSRPGTR